mgnify:CR=1 FL=1
MKKLTVYADFDWMTAPERVGELSVDSVRGNETYSFTYDNKWLAEHNDIFLSADLRNYPGVQYARPERDIFGCFSDALPDRWGRTLLNRREQILAQDEKRPMRRLTSFDYLTGIDDASRMGGFRFASSDGGEFINASPNLRVPPLASVRELMHAAHEIETSEEKQQLPAKKWLMQLLHPGTSLGGARPKATVTDEDGSLTVAKFPSRRDDYDVALWEHLCHLLAEKGGINAAQTKVVGSEKHHILLSKRFDRTADGRRIHFASALTLLGLEDGDNASTGFGYCDIVDFILQHGTDVESNLQELFRRVAFYIIVGNSDDHFRNHGFLLTPKGWVLSPAYDINPTLDDQQSLLINRVTNRSDLNILMESAENYMLTRQTAGAIISEVKMAMKSWKSEALRIGIPKKDIERFAPKIDRNVYAEA